MAETAEAPVESTTVTTEQAPATTEQTTTTTTDTPDSEEQIATLLSAVDANPALEGDPKIKALADLARGKTTEPAKAEEPKTEPKTETKTEEPKAETKSPDTKDEPKTETKEEKPTSVFFKEDDPAKTQKVELKDINAFNSHIEEKFSIKDTTKFFESVDTWRSQAQNADTIQRELDNITNSFEKMPDAIFNAYKLWSNGEPWEGAVQGVGTLDFKMGFNEYDTHKIVNYYFPGEFTKDDFTGENKDSTTTKRAISLAKSQYASDKQAVEGQRAGIVDDANAQKERIKTSTASSVAGLKESFPSMGKAEIKKVESIMSGGDLSGLFFNEEGGYVKDAAQKIAMMLYAEKDIANANKRVKSSQDALKSRVDAGNEKPPAVTSTQGKKPVVPEAVSSLYGDLVDQKTY